MTGSTSAAVGHRAAARRRELHLSQQELAERTGHLGNALPRTAISAIENGQRSVTVDELLMLAMALDVTPMDLLDGRQESAGEPLEQRATQAAECIAGMFPDVWSRGIGIHVAMQSLVGSGDEPRTREELFRRAEGVAQWIYTGERP